MKKKKVVYSGKFYIKKGILGFKIYFPYQT